MFKFAYVRVCVCVWSVHMCTNACVQVCEQIKLFDVKFLFSHNTNTHNHLLLPYLPMAALHSETDWVGFSSDNIRAHK